MAAGEIDVTWGTVSQQRARVRAEAGKRGVGAKAQGVGTEGGERGMLPHLTAVYFFFLLFRDTPF